jgi:hypothetical protein
MTARDYWIDVLMRISTPVLKNLSQRTLRKNMPVERHPESQGRESVTHLEAIGRLLAGIAPWLGLREPSSQPLAAMAREALDAISDPASPDYCNWNRDGQPVVDAAFLVQGILRAPAVLWEPLEGRVKQNLVVALRSSRVIKPGFNNWLLFSAMVEAGLHLMDQDDWDAMRIDYALRQHEQWYKGDGAYGDGPAFHWDYYNAFVIQPMLIDVLGQVRSQHNWASLFSEKVLARARRYAAVQERLISPEGTFPPIGRSLAYRFGALQVLAQMALMRQLPEDVSPAQVREAMTAVIRRTMEMPGTFDEQGWLRIGFCGQQPGIGEKYISTGSLYLCSVGLLPLGLPAGDAFWSDPPQPWTAKRAWSGESFPIDHAIGQ